MKPSSARLVVDALKQNEIRLITVLPDSWMFEVYELISKDSYFKVVPVTHEAEGVCICAGAWCAGLRAAIIWKILDCARPPKPSGGSNASRFCC